MSRRRDDTTWGEILFMLLLVVLLLWGIHACEAPDKAACEARGGVWLSRDWACVAPPEGGNR